MSSAIIFFVCASAMLLILFMFIDYLRPVFTILIMFSCVGCSSIMIEEILLHGLKPRDESFLRKEYKLPCFGKTNMATIIGTLCGIVLSVAWVYTKNWMLNNILAIFLALTFLKTLRLNSLMPGVVLLGLLFFYDIFWVFLSPMFTGGQSVMVVVATGLDIPIKIVMPHITAAYPTSGCSLLGLGDILIPGIFIIFMARFGTEVVNTEKYFYAAIIAYAIALFTCGACLWIFSTA